MHWLKTTFVDLCARWVIPALNVVTVLMSSLLFTNPTKQVPELAPLWAVLNDRAQLTLLIVSLIASLGLSIFVSCRQPSFNATMTRLNQAQAQIDEFGSNIPNLFDGLLLNLSKRLGFSQVGQARVSLYVHDKKVRFIPCGRYSPNPELRKPGRTSYPDNEGCIAQGWREEWYYNAQIPTGVQRQQRYHEANYGITERTFDRLNMKSRLYAVKRIDNAAGTAVAVIVVEAIDPDAFSEEALRKELQFSSDDFGKMVDTLRNHIPEPSDAEELQL